MHIELLVEDQSCQKAMEILLPKLLPAEVSHRIHSYKGLGNLPKDMRPGDDSGKRILLDQLPRLLQGYGRTPHACDCVVVICDLDDRDRVGFLAELNDVLSSCQVKPETYFCLAVEEMEAWYLGDIEAIRKAYPSAALSILHSYRNDSICGTWELLADAVYKGGHRRLKKLGWQSVGKEKSQWALRICPHMDVTKNKSPSFNFLREKLREIMHAS